MHQYTFDEVLHMSYEQLGAIQDPMQLSAATFVSPMLARYLVKTGQLTKRYPEVGLRALLQAINAAATTIPWPADVAQKVPAGTRDAKVDEYLDALQPFVRQALHPH